MKRKVAYKNFKYVDLYFRQDFMKFGIRMTVVKFKMLNDKFGIIIEFAFWEFEITIK